MYPAGDSAMTAVALGRGDFARWMVSGAVALGLHAVVIAVLAARQVPLDGDQGTAVVMVDLAPFSSADLTPANQDIAPGPLQEQAEEHQSTHQEEKPEEKIEVPTPAPDPDLVMRPEKPEPETTPKEQAPPAPIATAPPPPRPSAAQVSSWHRAIALQIERHKGYPAAAKSHRQTGVVQLTFAIDRSGRLVRAQIAQTSGVAALDQETLATVRRAQPFPQPPPNMPGQTFEFTVPIRFNIRS
jgi:protein TonB